MDIMKGLAREELENSVRIRDSYKRALGKLPKGSLSRKIIKGNEYYYLSYRDKSGKVQSRYLGKLSDVQLKRYQEKIRRRREYAKLMKKSEKQIVFFQRVVSFRQ